MLAGAPYASDILGGTQRPGQFEQLLAAVEALDDISMSQGDRAVRRQQLEALQVPRPARNRCWLPPTWRRDDRGLVLATAEDLPDAVDYYLRNAALREEIAARGMEAARKYDMSEHVARGLSSTWLSRGCMDEATDVLLRVGRLRAKARQE